MTTDLMELASMFYNIGQYESKIEALRIQMASCKDFDARKLF